MEISEEQLQEFITLCKKELGLILTPAEAQQKAFSLLRFLAVSVAPIDLAENADRIEKPDLS